MAEHNWQEFYEMQSIGDSGTFGIKILVQTDHSITGEERRLAASATGTKADRLEAAIAAR